MHKHIDLLKLFFLNCIIQRVDSLVAGDGPEGRAGNLVYCRFGDNFSGQ